MPRHWAKSLKQRLEPEKWSPYRKCKNAFFQVKWEPRRITGGEPRFTVLAENGESWVFAGVPGALFDEFRKRLDAEVLLASMIAEFGIAPILPPVQANKVTAVYGDMALDTLADDLKTFDEWFESLSGMEDLYRGSF